MSKLTKLSSFTMFTRHILKVVGGLLPIVACSRSVLSNDMERRNKRRTGVASTYQLSNILMSYCDDKKGPREFIHWPLKLCEWVVVTIEKIEKENLGESEYELGFVHLGKNKLPEALKFFQLAADRGNKDALLILICLYNNNRTIKSSENAKKYLNLAANLGMPTAQCIMAINYLLGEGGVARNAEEAERLFKLSANQGFLQAQYMLADLYMRKQFGTEPTEQKTQALHYFKLAADQGHHYSTFQVEMLSAKPREKFKG